MRPCPRLSAAGAGPAWRSRDRGPVWESRESDCTQGAACWPHWVAATAVCGARAGPEAPAAWSGTAHDACTVGQSRHPQFASAAAHTPVRPAFVVAGQGPPPARTSDLCCARGLADDSSCVIAQFALLTMTMLGGEAGYIECTFRSAPCACPCVFRLHDCMRILLVDLGLLSLTPCAACAHCMLGVLTTRLLCPPLRRRRRLRRPVLGPRLLRHPLDAAHGLCQQLRRWPLPLVLRLPPAVSSGPCVGTRSPLKCCRLAAKSSGHDSVVVRLHDHFSIGHARASIPGLALSSSKLPACVPRHSWTALPCVICLRPT